GVAGAEAAPPPPPRGLASRGLAERMLNYDRVMAAARIFSEPCGLAVAAKAITVSTVGVVPAIRRFTAERRPYRLVVSLTSADSGTRRGLMPVDASHPPPELVEALWEYHRATRPRAHL